MKKITVRHLSKSFKDQKVLKDINDVGAKSLSIAP